MLCDTEHRDLCFILVNLVTQMAHFGLYLDQLFPYGFVQVLKAIVDGLESIQFVCAAVGNYLLPNPEDTSGCSNHSECDFSVIHVLRGVGVKLVYVDYKKHRENTVFLP